MNTFIVHELSGSRKKKSAPQYSFDNILLHFFARHFLGAPRDANSFYYLWRFLGITGCCFIFPFFSIPSKNLLRVHFLWIRDICVTVYSVFNSDYTIRKCINEIFPRHRRYIVSVVFNEIFNPLSSTGDSIDSPPKISNKTRKTLWLLNRI